MFVVGNNALLIQFSDFDILPSGVLPSITQTSFASYLNKYNIKLSSPLDVSILQPLPSFIVLS